MARHKVGIKQRQPGMGSHPLMRYEQAIPSIVVGTGSAGDDSQATLFDNSGTAGSKYLRIGKMTVQQFWDFNTDGRFYVCVFKAKEGATAPSLSDEQTIRDLRSEGRLIRGPWMVTSLSPNHGLAGVKYAKKTIVLEDLLLDPNDDLMMSLTQVASTSGTNTISMLVRTFWRVTE